MLQLDNDILVEYMADQKRLPNEWLYLSFMDIYVRKSNRYIKYKNIVKPELEPVFELASISVNRISRSQGLFTQWLPEFEELVEYHGWKYLIIENVLDQRFGEFFLRNGYATYQVYTQTPYLVTFIKDLYDS